MRMKFTLTSFFSLSLFLVLAGCSLGVEEEVQTPAADEASEAKVTEEATVLTQKLAYIVDTKVASSHAVDVPSSQMLNTSYFISYDPVELLSLEEGTCTDIVSMDPALPRCDENGFLVVNSSTDPEKRTFGDVFFSLSKKASILTTAFGQYTEATQVVTPQNFSYGFSNQKEYYSKAIFELGFDGTTIVSIKELPLL